MEIKPVLIIESSSNGLFLNESASAPKDKRFILSGTFTEFDVKNRNDRIYTKDKFLPHLQELNERIKVLGAVYGEFDHPDAFDISLSRISHVLEDVRFNQEKNRIDGSIRLLSTHYGKEAQALVQDKCPIFVSSRAAGVTESDGTVTIKKLFTYDAVADPGFSSARMELRSLNESLGFNESANFRVYDMSDESKINKLFEMNGNEEKTKEQFIEYADYLKGELAKIKEQMEQNIKQGQDPEQLNKLSEYYEVLLENHNKITKYLDYLADNIQILVSENTDLKKKTEKLIEHTDYLAENLEKSINYSNYLAEKLDKSIDYSEYISESLSKSIDFTEYVAENVEKTIKYSEYLAENLEKSIDYSEYIAEHTEFNIQNNEMLSEYVDNSIKYSEYVAEQVDNNIQYAEYLAEHLDNNIAYAEYVAEHVDNNIAYTEYIAEHVDNNIAYSEYIAENLSDTQAYSKYIAESLDKTIDAVNGSKLNEDVNTDDQRISDMKVANVDKYYDNDDDNFGVQNTDSDLPTEFNDIEEEEEEGDNIMSTEQPTQIEEPTQLEEPIQDETPVQGEIPTDVQPIQGQGEDVVLLPGTIVEIETPDGEQKGEILSFNPTDGFAIVKISSGEGQVQPQSQPVQSGDVQVQPQAQIDGVPQGEGQVQIQGQPTGQGQIQTQVQTQVQPQTQAQEIRVHESKIKIVGDKVFETEKSIKESISQLIAEAKKRKASEEQEPHFLLFLTEKNKNVWKQLNYEDKEKIVVAMNESSYSSEKDVLNIIRETLDNSKLTEEQVLINAIPNDLIQTWNSLNDTVKNSVLAQAKFYPNLTNSQAKLESFWNSRVLEKYSINENKTLLNENKKYINDLKLSENQVDRYIGIFKNLS